MRRAALAAGLLLAAQWACAQFTGLPGTVLRFATVDQGREVLAADDDWLQATSDFQRAAVMGVKPPVSPERFRSFQAGTVNAWTPEGQQRWTRALAEVAPRLQALHAPLPPEVLLVSTDGRDAADAPYTRGHAVMLPQTVQVEAGYTDAEVMAHELFHVLTRHRPELATRLYALVGFEPVPPLQWPEAWRPLRIANPDAPHHRHAMRATVEGRPVLLMPLLVAGRTALQPGESFFDVMELRLLEVTVDGGSTRPVPRADGQPAWLSPKQAGDYLQRLGGNTGYVIHPEETVADNFAFLVSGRKVRNPALLQAIERVLKEAATR
jgi:hypothetical protein